MSRRLIGLALLLAAPRAYGQDALPPETTPPAAPPALPAETTPPAAPPATPPEATPEVAPATTTETPTETATTEPASSAATGELAPADMSDQAIAAALGAAIGGRTTAGGLRVAGHYLYQLTAQDWFDGTAAFTFGSGGAECFRDRDNDVLCDHGLADGYAVELSANVRRFLGGRDNFWPFVRAGLGVAIVRFSDDDVTGIAFPLHAGAGLRVSVADGVALVGLGEVSLGLARFGGGVGAEPQLGVDVSAGVEFRL